MRKFVYISVFVLLLSCNGENVPDCFQNAGPIIQKEFALNTFDKVTIFERVELIIKDEATQSVVLESGEYLMNDIEVYVEDGRLIVKNNNACNLTRDYGITKVYVSSPNLTEIRNGSGLTVSSDGVLNYESFILYSEDFGVEDGFYHTDGDFNLQVNSDLITIVTNDVSNIFMSGAVEKINIQFFSGNGRFEGANLIAQNVNVYHRGTNDMIINPQQSLTGQIRSIGDVISLNQPPTVSVIEYYTGRVIFD